MQYNDLLIHRKRSPFPAGEGLKVKLKPFAKSKFENIGAIYDKSDTYSSGIYEAFENGSLDAAPFESSNQPNELRKALVQPLALNAKAREYLLVLNAGFVKILQPGRDTIISTGFSVENAQDTITKFEEYVQTHRDEEEALRIIAENTGEPITYAMLEDLKKKFLSANSQFSTTNGFN